MRLVDAILQRVEIIAVANIRAGVDLALFFQFRIAWQRRHDSFAEVGEDQAQILQRGAATNGYFLRETFVFRRLLDALAGAVVFPAVVETADAIVLDPADRQLRAAMGTTKINDIGRTACAAIKREAFAQDAYRHRVAGFQFVGNINRLPEHSQIPSG